MLGNSVNIAVPLLDAKYMIKALTPQLKGELFSRRYHMLDGRLQRGISPHFCRSGLCFFLTAVSNTTFKTCKTL